MRDKLKFFMLSGAIFYNFINAIYQFIKPFLNNKMSIFEEYGALKKWSSLLRFRLHDDFFVQMYGQIWIGVHFQ